MFKKSQQCTIKLDSSMQELDATGSKDFGCIGYDELYGYALGDDLPWHWHEGFEAILCVEGALSLTVAHTTVTLEGGSAAFINAWRPHCASGSPKAHIRSVVYDEALVAGGVGTAIAQRYTTPLKTAAGIDLMLFEPGDEAGKAFCNHLAQAVEQLELEPAGYEIVARDHISQLTLLAWECAGKQAALGGKNPIKAERAKLMRDFIAEHYAEKLTMEQVAAAADVCEREGLRCFTEIVGMSPSRYLLLFRLARGAELLSSTGLGVAEVAHAVGIKSPSNFTQLFRRDYHCTPREYRARTQGRG